MAVEEITKLLAEGSVKKLDACVNTSLRLIKDMKAILKKSETHPEVSKWIEALNKLEKQTISRRTVMGVFGNTGAGKSSLINAVLGEECLLPTNCMRACTAAVTELSWNKDEDPRRRYTAEVQFITSEDWATELQILISDLEDGKDQVGGVLESSDTEAGIAMAKIRAVYPNLDERVLGMGAPALDELMQESSVKEVLGVTKHFYAATAQSLHEQLRPYVDSKAKEQSNRNGADENSAMAVWPLLKVVRIFTRSPVLENGLVLVDLPGLQDSNAARAAVAENYKEQCTGYWIVAPITRGIDDKTAQTLMGESFKRELQLDGGIPNVTMVYTKTDDITVTEAQKDLTGEWRERLLSIRMQMADAAKLCQEKAVAVEKLRSTIKDSEQLRSQNEKRIQDLKKSTTSPVVETGDLARVSTRKRRLSDVSLPEPKRTHVAADSASLLSDSQQVIDNSASQGGARQTTMSKVEILEGSNQQLKQKCEELKKQVTELENERNDLRRQTSGLSTQSKKQCILFRNDYSRNMARVQFVRGIKELDDDIAMELDEDSFDPTQNQRDYTEVSRQLQVFCVSSRAYLKLSGKLKDDEAVLGFDTTDDTEIPLLQKLAVDQAETMLSAACRKFLQDMLHVIRSLGLRVATVEEPLKLAAKDKRKENRVLSKSLDTIIEEFEQAEMELFSSLQQSEDYVLQSLAFGADMNLKKPTHVADEWFRPRRLGGMTWVAFKNACKGDGVNKQAGVDLHDDLVKPWKKFIGRSWEEVFGKNIFSALSKFGQMTSTTLAEFRENVVERESLIQSAASATAFSELVRGYEQSLRDAHTEHEKLVTESQRAATRLIKPAIAATMAPVYRACAKETGKGCYKRMKDRIYDHLSKHEDMISITVDEVKSRIERLIATLRKEARARDELILDDIKSRLSELVKGKTRFSKSFKDTLGQVRNLLAGASALYGKIIAMDDNETIGPNGVVHAGGADQLVAGENMDMKYEEEY